MDGILSELNILEGVRKQGGEIRQIEHMFKDQGYNLLKLQRIRMASPDGEAIEAGLENWNASLDSKINQLKKKKNNFIILIWISSS